MGSLSNLQQLSNKYDFFNDKVTRIYEYLRIKYNDK